MTRSNSCDHSYLRRLSAARYKQLAVKMSVFWLGLLVLCAVFAPFLANSSPLLMSEKGHISSPVLLMLSVYDLSLLTAAISLLILWWLPLSANMKQFLFLLTVVTSIALGSHLLEPPRLSVYEQYRENSAAGLYDWAIYPPVPYSPQDYLRDREFQGFQSPDHDHWLGSEENGADVLSRLIHASRTALGIGLAATAIALLIAVLTGSVMGYFSGITDIIGMRLVEIFESIPTLILLLTFIAFFGSSMTTMIVIIGMTSWPVYARYVRIEFLRLRHQDYVRAAVATGLPVYSILFRHMLPNALAPVLVAASFGVATAILAEATLSFLGLGLVDTPSWGAMLNQAVHSSSFNWWMAVFPGGAIFFTVMAYHLIGDVLREAIDPHRTKT